MKCVQYRNFRWAGLIAVALFTTMSGCGGGSDRNEETVAIQGKVTFNGGPITAGSILVLESKELGVSRTATLAEDGTYSLGGTAALPVGNYKVALTPPRDGQSAEPGSESYDDMMSGSSDPQPKNENEASFPVPEHLRSTNSTDKTIEIKSGESTYDIDFSG